MEAPWLWAVFTLIAATAQTFRNAAQRSLTGPLGTVGATHVRFLFGLPFGLMALAVVAAFAGPLPAPNLVAIGWTALGAVSQIAATALMLAAMRERSFVVTIAYTKTEPVQVAVFAVVFLGEDVSLALATAMALLTAWLVVRQPEVLAAIFAAWRQSLAAGFLGAFASEMWFLAFALQSPARVRTLGLVEVLLAGLVSRQMFAQTLSLRDVAGMLMIVAGIALLFNG